MELKVKEIIINAARTIFARFGFDKTTMNDIAKAAHKAKSSLYHYFRNKENIFREVVERESDVLKKKIVTAVKSKDHPKEKLSVYIITRMEILDQLANYYSALKDEYLKHYGFIEKLRQQHLVDEIEMIKKILEEGHKKAVFYVEDLDMTAAAIVTALRGLEYPWATDKRFSDTKKSINNILGILFDGIVKR